MIHALEARRRTFEIIYRNNLKFFDMVALAVSTAIEEGNFSVNIEFPDGYEYSDSVNRKLHQLGYSVSYTPMVNGLFSNITLTWYHPFEQQDDQKYVI